METASAGKHGITGKSDCRTVGKQLGNGRNALRIMRAPERRHHHQMACYGEIRIARWLDVVATGYEPGGRDFLDRDAGILGTLLGIGIDCGVGIVSARRAG